MALDNAAAASSIASAVPSITIVSQPFQPLRNSLPALAWVASSASSMATALWLT